MSMKYITGKATILLASSLAMAVVSGCAQMPARNQGGTTAADRSAPSQAGECNPAAAAAIGALAGALFGKGKGHLVGAAVGAGIGAIACTAYNYHAKKVRDAQAVNADYIRERGALPATTTVASYTSALQPSATVRAGTPTELSSNIVVVSGMDDQAPRLTETLTLYSPEGKQLSTVTKQANEINGGGEYETSFNFNLPKGVENGRYTVRSTLFMGDKQVGSNEVPMLVVS